VALDRGEALLPSVNGKLYACQAATRESCGFARGFRVISDTAHVVYKATDYYAPEHERTVVWNDPDLKIKWDLDAEPTVSAKDQRGIALRAAETFA
jgi:dTDP-4-dehydrorhamnose 3,5-epimerase